MFIHSIDLRSCQHFYFVARGQQIEAEKTQSKYMLHKYKLKVFAILYSHV